MANLMDRLKEKAKFQQMSLHGYLSFVLNYFAGTKEILFEENIRKPEKKTVESRVFFTQSEAELLRKYAELNSWSMTKEIRFRLISMLAKKLKLNAEELTAICSVRSSINVLGAILIFARH